MPNTNGHGSEVERVALYLRVSSEEQKTKETIDTQEDFLEEYCKLYRHEIAEVYKDEAVSGTVPVGERPAGRELLEDARAGKFDVVLVYKLDRIGRALLVVVDAHDRLHEAGVALRSATEPIDTSTPAGLSSRCSPPSRSSKRRPSTRGRGTASTAPTEAARSPG